MRHSNTRDTKTSSLPKELLSIWVSRKGHTSGLRMLLSGMRRGVKICHSESMAAQGGEGWKRLPGTGRPRTCLGRKGRDLMNKAGRDICVRQASMRKGMKAQKRDKRKSWISSIRIMVFCWQCKIQGKFLSGECLRKIAVPPPSPWNSDQQHCVVFSAGRQAGLLYQPSVAPGASRCLREAPASSDSLAATGERQKDLLICGGGGTLEQA